MPWCARIDLDYLRAPDSGRTLARFRHEGPLRLLRSLYPEGEAICHNVLIHPPGGLVGGDRLDIRIDARTGSHGLITTPGATRYYRSEGEAAVQDTRIAVRAGARLEWLPLETLCYDDCLAENRLHLELEPQAELIGWDVLALGLPDAERPFRRGAVLQHLELAGIWRESGRIEGGDACLLDGPVGLAGHRCMATVFFASGTPLAAAAREHALDIARAAIEADPLRPSAGATSPDPRLVVVRVLAPRVEPAMRLARRVRGAWRSGLWQLHGAPPRVWAI